MLLNLSDEIWLRDGKFWIFVHLIFFLTCVNVWLALPWTIMWLENEKTAAA